MTRIGDSSIIERKLKPLDGITLIKVLPNNVFYHHKSKELLEVGGKKDKWPEAYCI